MDHIQIEGRAVLVLMKQRMHVLPKYRALLFHAYKPHTCGQPRLAQQCVLPHRVTPTSCLLHVKQGESQKLSMAFGRKLAGHGVWHGGIDKGRRIPGCR